MGRPRNEQTAELGSDSFLDVMANMVGILIILVVMVGVRVKDGPKSPPSDDPAPPSVAQAPNAEAPIVDEAAASPISVADEPRALEPPPIPKETEPPVLQPAPQPEPVVETPAEEPIPELPPPIDLASYHAELTALEKQTVELAGRTATLEIDANLRDRQSSALEIALAERRTEIERKKIGLEGAQREAVELGGRLHSADLRMRELQKHQAALEEVPQQVVKLENYPTPLAQAAKGEQLHFQIRDGRVAVIPLKGLMDEVERTVRNEASRLRQQSAISLTVGPVGDFRLTYHILKNAPTLQDQMRGMRPGMDIEERWELEPVVFPVGEPIERALMPGSQFQSMLAELNPRQVTITLWVYPNSFTAYRDLRRELHRQGFPTAGRPLPLGVPIAGSTKGSRSVAQ